MTPVKRVLSKLPDARPNGEGWVACCPAHDDHNPSLSITGGDGGRALLKCHAGCKTEEVVAAMGLEINDLMPPGNSDCAQHGQDSRRCPTQKGGHLGEKWPSSGGDGKVYGSRDEAIKAAAQQINGQAGESWPYRAADGQELFWIARFETAKGKTYRPVSRKGEGWVIGDPPGMLPLYRLPKLAVAGCVYVCEGEKAAEALAAIGLTATTSAHGNQSPAKTDWQPLADRDVVILPDNDDAGRAYAQKVASLLGRLRPAPSVRILELPDLPDKGDAFDLVEGHKRQGADPDTIRSEIEALADKAPAIDSSADSGSDLVLVRMSDVEPQPLQWLWPGRIPLGKLTIIVGDPGLGKSLITLDMAARVSKGMPWPDQPGAGNPVGSVVLLSAEDDVADTIRPRLDAAEADVERIVTVQAVRQHKARPDDTGQRMFCLVTDLSRLDRAIEGIPEARLIVIDPITAYLGKTDSHKNADIRGLLAPLAALAARHNVAVVAVTHLNKNAGGSAMYRTMGSLAFVAAARSAWVIVKDKDNPTLRVMLPVKNNLSAVSTGLAYSLVGSTDGGVAVVKWAEEPVHISAEDALAVDDGDCGEREQAKDWLRLALADGPMESKEVIRQGRDNGISEKTLRRAAKAVGIKPRKTSFGGGWTWELPHEDGQRDPEDAQDGQVTGMATFDHLGPQTGGE